MPAPPETDVAKIQKYCQTQVPAHLRDQIRIETTVRGSSVTIVECRPLWRADPTEWSKVRVAQLRYSTSAHDWSLYWADRNGRWHRYDPTGIFWASNRLIRWHWNPMKASLPKGSMGANPLRFVPTYHDARGT